VTQKLDIFDLTFIASGEDDGRKFQTGVIFNIVNEYFIGNIFKNDSNQMSIVACIDMESGSY
jgi:hypothetical protein